MNEDGFREVLGAAEGMKEDKASWVSFFQWLRGRGLDGVKLIVDGVIRPSSRNPPRRNGLIEIAQIFGILKKNLGRLTAQGVRGFLR